MRFTKAELETIKTCLKACNDTGTEYDDVDKSWNRKLDLLISKADTMVNDLAAPGFKSLRTYTKSVKNAPVSPTEEQDK